MNLNKIVKVISNEVGDLPLKEGGATFKPSGFKRETQSGEVPENTGYIESPTPAELTLTLNASLDPQDFNKCTNDLLTITFSGGSVHNMSNAWVTEAVELGNGELKVTFNSAKSEKLS